MHFTRFHDLNMRRRHEFPIMPMRGAANPARLSPRPPLAETPLTPRRRILRAEPDLDRRLHWPHALVGELRPVPEWDGTGAAHNSGEFLSQGAQ
jgi:hypothetical protein